MFSALICLFQTHLSVQIIVKLENYQPLFEICNADIANFNYCNFNFMCAQCKQSIIFWNGENYWIQVAKLRKLHVANYQLVLISQRGYRITLLN